MEYNKIQFGELVGRGSYGTVHKGVWKEQTVALKRLQIPPGMDKSQVVANSQEIAALRYLLSMCCCKQVHKADHVVCQIGC